MVTLCWVGCSSLGLDCELFGVLGLCALFWWIWWVTLVFGWVPGWYFLGGACRALLSS